MSEVPTKEEFDEIKQWFKERIDEMNRMEIAMDARYKKLDNKPFGTSAWWSSLHAKMTFWHFKEVYEMIQLLLEIIFEQDKEASDFGKQLDKFKGEIERHRPIVHRLEEAFEVTDRIFKENR